MGVRHTLTGRATRMHERTRTALARLRGYIAPEVIAQKYIQTNSLPLKQQAAVCCTVTDLAGRRYQLASAAHRRDTGSLHSETGTATGSPGRGYS